MTSVIAKFVGKKILGETMANKFGTEDPYFEQVPATRLDGTPKPGKFKKVRKALPPGISEKDGQVLTKVKRRAYRLDMCLFNCCGIRFGWASVIGIIPAIGDVIDALLALMVVRTCQQIEGGLPSPVKAKMYFNIMLDFGIGLVPFLGDIADAVFRANTRNAALLEEHLRQQGKKNLRQSGLPIPAVDPSDPHEFDRLHMEDHPEHVSQQPSQHHEMVHTARNGNGNGHGNGNGNGNGNGQRIPPAATPARVQEGTRTNSRLSDFFRSASTSRPHDLEMGHAPQTSGTATLKKQQRRR